MATSLWLLIFFRAKIKKGIPSVSASSPGGHNGVPQDPLSALEMTRLALWKMYNQAGGAAGLPGGLHGLSGMPGDMMALSHHHHDKFAEHRQRMLEAAQAARDESDNEDKCDDVDIADTKDDVASDKDSDDERHARRSSRIEPPPQTPPEIRASRAEILEGEEDVEEELEEEEAVDDVRRLNGSSVGSKVDNVENVDFSTSASPAAKKRRRSDDDVEDDPNLEMTSPRKMTSMGLGIPGANIKISSRGKTSY